MPYTAGDRVTTDLFDHLFGSIGIVQAEVEPDWYDVEWIDDTGQAGSLVMQAETLQPAS